MGRDFETGEYYHVYNRGVDKRQILSDNYDSNRFLKCMDFFNSTKPIGSLYQLTFEKPEETKSKEKLVDIIAYCLNPNHYHFILKQLVDGGISEFMKRVNGGYAWYFNFKTKRTGALFQGKFKAKFIDGNDYLLRVSAYVNLNNRVHQLSGPTAKLIRSSWEYYVSHEDSICNPSIILQQFKNRREYEKFALEALPQMLQRKDDEKELKNLLLE